MKKKILLGLGLTTVVVVSVGYIATKPYLDENARIQELADQLERREGDASTWKYTYDFKVPSSPTVANWPTDDIKVPQILFTIPNEDITQISYWAMGIDGSDPQLLIPEGKLAPTPQTIVGGILDFGKYISRSPNGRYMVIPQNGGTVLYDLDNGEITKLGEVSKSHTFVLWEKDSSQAVIKKGDELTLIKLPSKEVLQFNEINGTRANIATRASRVVMSTIDNAIYMQLQRDGDGWFSCYDMELYKETFGKNLTKCGNTLVIDPKTLKVIDRGNYIPNESDCLPWGSILGDSFNCTSFSDKGQIYQLGYPFKEIERYKTNGLLLALNGGEQWYVSINSNYIYRVLTKKNKVSPTKKMIYTFGYIKSGERSSIRDFGFGISRYVLEHAKKEKWSEYLYPLPSYADLEKAKVVLEERNHG